MTPARVSEGRGIAASDVNHFHNRYSMEFFRMLGLIPFLTASGIEFDPSNMKIHLACWNGVEHPIDVFYAGHWQEWQDGQTRRNFECTHVLSLIDLGQSHWLFVGVYQVLGCQPNPNRDGHFLYSTKLLPHQNELIGRVIVYHKRSRASYIWNTPEIVLPIIEIRREKPEFGISHLILEGLGKKGISPVA